jgi:hypothetical protein
VLVECVLAQVPTFATATLVDRARPLPPPEPVAQQRTDERCSIL